MAVIFTKKDQGKTITTGNGVPSHSAIAGDEYTDTTSGVHYIYTTLWVELLSGTSGASGTSGSSGTSGVNGSSGTSGISGNNGTSGSSGTSGIDGSSGTSGINGTSGIDGTSGTNGTSGIDGTSGMDGTSGIDGTSGVSGSSGTSGVDGTSGVSGTSGIDGTSGINGSSGTSGIDGSSGTSGINGTSGTSGVSAQTGIFGIADSGGTYTYYSTLTLAMSAATSGQTIEQFTEVTESGNVTITWKDGVNFNGNGHTYTHSYSSGDSNTINIPTTTVTCTIFNWRVIRTGRSNGTATDYAFYVIPGGFSSNNSTIKFSGVYIDSTYGNSVNFDAQGGTYYGTLYAKGYLNGLVSYSNTLDGLYGESTSSGNGLVNGGSSTTNCTGKSVSGRGLYGSNVRNCVGVSTSYLGLGQGSNGTGPYYNCFGISVSSAGGAVGSFYNCTLISSSGVAGDSIQGSNNTLISSTNYAWYTFFNNYLITDTFMVSSSNVAAVSRGAIIKNCTLKSEYNNSAGHAYAEWAGGFTTKITNCNLEVTNSSANCINTSTAVTMKIALCSFDGSTTPINANITQSLTNTQDNQGNIVL